ncbi:MAG: hypothetical protein IKZ56_13200 [Bacteroidales bacterium]|nr:hypothetical protein [Bacteroidales bacterium]MBR5922108.1 hypothetical protein [Bacteroidales bacterium]
MNTTIEKPLDYRCFLLGIIVYWMFEAVWTSFAPFFFNLEGLSGHPVAVVVGKSVLFLLVFYLLFRKPKMFNIKWVHIAILVGFLVLMHVLDYFLVDRLGDIIRDKWVLSDVPDYVMRDVRKWVNLVTSFLTIGFLWWRYDLEVTASDIDTSVVESRSYYGGILFSITFGYILSLINKIGGFCWEFVSHPVLEELITCLLLVLFTVGAIYLLVKKRLMVLPIVAIFIIVLVHFFSTNYLYYFLKEHLTSDLSAIEQMVFFSSVFMICDWAFFIATFVLYRKEMKQPAL